MQHLAKQLKIDSKALVEVCTKAGVTGKGSALASLSDEEVAQVNSEDDFLELLELAIERQG